MVQFGFLSKHLKFFFYFKFLIYVAELNPKWLANSMKISKISGLVFIFFQLSNQEFVDFTK